MSNTQDVYEKQYKKQLNFIEKFTDGFALPDASVLDGGFTNQGRAGVGFTSPNAIIHFVAPEARFNEQEQQAEQDFLQNARAQGGKVSVRDLISHRAQLGHPDGERLDEIVQKSNAINEQMHDQGAYVTNLETHTRSIEGMFNSIAAQYNEAIKADATKSPVPPKIAVADGTSLHVNLDHMGKILETMPQVGPMLLEAATDYTKNVHTQHASAQIAEVVDQQVGQNQAVRELT